MLKVQPVPKVLLEHKALQDQLDLQVHKVHKEQLDQQAHKVLKEQ